MARCNRRKCAQSYTHGPSLECLSVSLGTCKLIRTQPWARRTYIPRYPGTMKNWRLWAGLVAVTASAGVGAGALSSAGLGGYTSLRLVSAGLALLLFISMASTSTRIALLNLPVLAFVVWSALSVLWSPERGESVSTLVGVVAVAMLGVCLASLHREFDIPKLLMWLFTVTSVVSVLLAFFWPSVGGVVVDHPTEGTHFQPSGLFIWNSDFGFSAALGAVLAAGISLREKRWWLLGLAAINVGAVWYSDSAAAVIVLVGATYALILMQGVRSALILGGLTLVLALSALLAIGGPRLLEILFGLLGRSSTLTGRTALWEETLRQAASRPWVGHGVGTSPDLSALSTANHAHNGVIQLYYDRGIIGVTIMAAIIIISVGLAVRNRDSIGVAILVAVLCANIANSYLTFASLGLLLLLWQAYRQLDERVRNRGKAGPGPWARSSSQDLPFREVPGS